MSSCLRLKSALGSVAGDYLEVGLTEQDGYSFEGQIAVGLQIEIQPGH